MTNRWWVSSVSIATKSYHPHITFWTFSRLHVLWASAFWFSGSFLPPSRERETNMIACSVTIAPNSCWNFYWRQFRGWISMTIRRKMKEGSISNEALISNVTGTVTKKKTKSTVQLQWNESQATFQKAFQMHVQVWHFRFIIDKIILILYSVTWTDVSVVKY